MGGWLYCITCLRTLKRLDLGTQYKYVCRGCDKQPKDCSCERKTRS